MTETRAHHGMTTETGSRDSILARLRSVVGHVPATPDVIPTTVIQSSGDHHDLARQFGDSLTAVGGAYELLEQNAVAQRVMQLIEEWVGVDTEKEILGWAPEALPVPDLAQSLAALGATLHVPEDGHDRDTRARSARAQVGLTGADAAIASTGSMVLSSGTGKSRVASLLPLHHIALVPMSRIYLTIEAWLAARRKDDLRSLLVESGQVVFVTGPSKSADIELRLTLGVHGPRVVHALVFDDDRTGEQR